MQVVRVDLETVLRYAEELERTLEGGSQSERKAFLAGLIEMIIVDDRRIEIEYRLPVRPEMDTQPSVLHSTGSGGDERIRTADLRVANAALSQLSYIPGTSVGRLSVPGSSVPETVNR